MSTSGSGTTYKVWAAQTPKTGLLLIHGLGANPSWWEAFGSEAQKNNLSSYAVDLRDHKSFDVFFNVINELLVKIREETPGRKIFAIGESMGALIILAMALKNQAIFDGLVCISPAFNSKAPLKLTDYFRIFLPLFYDPDKRCALPVSSDMCTRDPKYLKMLEATYDKDVLATSRVLFDIFVVQQNMKYLPMRIASPLLFLLAGNDQLAYSESSVKVFAKIKCPDKALIEYPHMYHSLSIDLGKEKVFQDIFSWAEKRI